MGEDSTAADGTGAADVARMASLAANLERVRARIAAACGPVRPAPTLIVVTKTWPAQDVRRLAGLGVQDVGENRDQEARPKHAQTADLGLRWHFIGQLQRNKAASVATYADVVHSLDREPLIAALGAAALRAGRVITGLVQVNLDPPDNHRERGGVAAADALALADCVASTPGLRLGGVMGVAPLGADPAEAFARLAEVAAAVSARHPEATMISAGMSGDLEAAITHGATHVRVGSSVLGSRPDLG